MWTIMLVAAAVSLAPNQNGSLTLTNVRLTYGALGAPRTDGKILPGDQVFITFDIEGITADAGGKVLYSMTTEVLDGAGKTLFKQEPRELATVNALGGKSLPAFVELNAGLDQPAGTYTVKVTVMDRASKASQVLTRTLQLAEKDFGLVRLTTTADPEGRVAASVFQPGASLWVNGGVVGFQRQGGKGSPQVSVELRILDDQGKPTMSQSFTGQLGKDLPAGALFAPKQFHVALNRPGKFTIQVKATDQVSKKTSTASFPITVVPSR